MINFIQGCSGGVLVCQGGVSGLFLVLQTSVALRSNINEPLILLHNFDENQPMMLSKNQQNSKKMKWLKIYIMPA